MIDSLTTDDEEFRILDTRGCLTLEAMCFVDELETEQREVVQRHIDDCLICAQQQTELIRARTRLQTARPRIVIPADMKVLVRQVALRKLDAKDRRMKTKEKYHSTARIRALRGNLREPFYRSRTFWTITLACLASVLLAVAISLAIR